VISTTVHLAVKRSKLAFSAEIRHFAQQQTFEKPLEVPGTRLRVSWSRSLVSVLRALPPARLLLLLKTYLVSGSTVIHVGL